MSIWANAEKARDSMLRNKSDDRRRAKFSTLAKSKPKPIAPGAKPCASPRRESRRIRASPMDYPSIAMAIALAFAALMVASGRI